MIRSITLVFAVLIVVQGSILPENKELLPRPRYDPNLHSVDEHGKIVGGFAINITDAPHQVSLQSRGRHICGGSIIANQWVLTAAHCTDGASASNLKVRVGSSRHASEGRLIDINRIVQHPNYNSDSIDYDYSLLNLKEVIEFGSNAKPIALPKQGEAVKDNTRCTISGWGNTQSSAESNAVLRAAYVPAVNQQRCNKAYEIYGGVTDRMICAGLRQGGRDSCQGDSGGPMVANKKLVGVVSWGLGCARPNYPGVYSRVAVVREWIRENAGV
ncbi:trypsin-1-like [Malaya genurostris]|uniref:trypsin-1-like n=1 Tax=Malaya genurostris TaxID=325434 RepID=UPI0026F4075D|nr:trypsin-1-like [Malaya genurostris]